MQKFTTYVLASNIPEIVPLALTLNQYIDVLDDQWHAVVDVGQLLQVEDLLTMGETIRLAPIPNLEAVDLEELPGPSHRK